MKKDRLDDLADSLKQMKGAILMFEAVANDCYPGAYKMDRFENERKRHQDRANSEACARDEQNDCLRRLGLHIAVGARLLWGDNGDIDCKFYLFDFDGNGIASGGTMQELIANIPKGE
jgi:hypothetical protein